MKGKGDVIKSKQASKRDRTLKNLHRYYLNDLTLTLLLIHHPFLNVKRHQGASNMQKVPICTRHRDIEGGGGTYSIQFSAYGGKASQGDGEYSQGTSHCRMSPLTVMPIAIG